MVELSDLGPAPGAKKSRRRVGRGPGSGRAKTCGRGHKGQKSRRGYSRRYGFEGGQMPLIRRIPKRGFHNRFKVEYQLVHVEDLERVFDDGATVTVDDMVENGLVTSRGGPVKVLSDGELTKKVTVHAHRFTGKAQEKIEAAGGRCEVVSS